MREKCGNKCVCAGNELPDVVLTCCHITQGDPPHLFWRHDFGQVVRQIHVPWASNCTVTRLAFANLVSVVSAPMNESECWPCENLKAVVDLTGHSLTAVNYVWSLVPFVVKDALKHNVSGEHLYQFLKTHQELTEDTAAKFHSTLHGVHKPHHLLDWQNWQQVDDLTFHIMWQLASPPAARVLRKVFHRPYFVQNISEVSLQRFLLFDGPHAPSYYLPETDFSSSWLVQVEGSRLVVLEPSELCVHHCRLVSVLLKPNDVLYFSSTISKARSIPIHFGDSPSITYLGSFY
ncbi:hypothetical protein V5799_017202 [Amblyomma americanum]|uniref:Uncharacterized protein n=1 Tax=Amblyomma americanum TaxID=6943 RepID=A0AAQ4F2S2_AMBAM